MTGRLAKRYARALLELAREESALEAWGEELGRAVATFGDPRLQPLVLSRAIGRDTRRQTVRSVVEALGVSRPVGNLVLLLASRGRLALLSDVALWYEALLDEEVGRVRGTVWSAAPLSARDQAAIVDLARQLTGRAEVVATVETDPELLGGVVLDVGGTVWDGSLKTQLARLGDEMAGGGA